MTASRTRVARPVTLALLAALCGCVHLPPVDDMSRNVVLAGNVSREATAPFVLDDNRIFVEIGFVRPDGTMRKALALVNMGSGSFVVTNALYRELKVDPAHPLHMTFGAMDIAIDGHDIEPESLANNLTLSLSPFDKPPTAEDASKKPGGDMAAFSAPLNVEAVVPPGLLQHFVVTFDYGAKTMTLATPDAAKREGTAVPMRVNSRTGFATVDVTLNGSRRIFVIDNGGSYSVARSVAPCLDDLRSVGGVGEANYTMSPMAPELGEPVVRCRHAAIGNVDLNGMGLVQWAGHGWMAALIADIFWDRIYSDKAGEPVDGWIGGNVLKSFRLTLDYPNRTSYWLPERPLDADELNRVGVVLARSNTVTVVAGMARKNDVETVTGVLPGDKLLKIDALETATATRGQLLDALHGKPGERRRLTLERDGKQIEIHAIVMGF